MPVTAQPASHAPPKGHVRDKPAAARARVEGAGGGPAADQPMNEPIVSDDSPNLTPGMFFGIQTKPPAHEQLARRLRNKIQDIYKMMHRLDGLFPAQDEEENLDGPARARRRGNNKEEDDDDDGDGEVKDNEPDQNQQNIEILQYLSDWLATVSFDVDHMGIPIGEDGLKVSRELCRDANMSVCKALEELRTINNSVLTFAGHNPTKANIVCFHTPGVSCFQSLNSLLILIDSMCKKTTSSNEDEKAEKTEKTYEQHVQSEELDVSATLTIIDIWKKMANEVKDIVIQMKSHDIPDFPFLEDRIVRLIQCLGEQGNIIRTLKNRLEHRTRDLSSAIIHQGVVNETMSRLKEEYLSIVGEEVGRAFLSSLEEDQQRDETKLKVKEQAVIRARGMPLIDEASISDPCVNIVAENSKLREENESTKLTLKSLMSTYVEEDAFAVLNAEKEQLTKKYMEAEKRFKSLISGVPLDEIIRTDNERLLAEQDNLAKVINDLGTRVRKMENERTAITEHMEQLNNQVARLTALMAACPEAQIAEPQDNESEHGSYE